VKNVLKKIWVTVAILVIILAVISSIFRSLTPWVKQYKGEVEHHLSLLVGEPVTIQTMETGWYWFQPVLKLRQVSLGGESKNALHLNTLLVGINLFKSLLNWQIEPGALYVDDMHLTLREKANHWTIDGISTNAMNNGEMTPKKTKQILIWLSQQGRVIIRHVSAHFHFSNGNLIPVNGLNMSLVNSGGHYKLKGDARLEQTNSTDFKLLGDGYFDPKHFEKIEGHFYFSAKNLVPAQWQILFPKTTEHLEGGKGNITLWLDLHDGAVSSLQAQVAFKRLAWRQLHNQHSQLIQSFFANVSWKPSDEGWKLEADRIQLRVGNVSWPENQLAIKYNKEQQSYQFFVKSIIVESLLSEAINWPESIQNILSIKPVGILRDTQVLIKDKKINYILTRFEQLGWKAKEAIPRVNNLSGVLNWQPDEGRLELDSENTSITVKGYPTQKLALLNGAFDWKELSDGLRVSIDRIILNKPDLTFSAQGAVDQVTRQSIGHIRLGAEFSGKNLQQWMAYLPKKHMKAKLYSWLTNDVKRLAQASGKITINGMAKDFPFDDNSGEFSITSHVSGGDILINPKWKIVKDLEGYIHFKNRNLDVDIVNADFQGVIAKQMSLRIDDIGKNKENLVIAGRIRGAVQKMMDYVMASPLKKKLANLKMLSIKGSALLNLSLQVPLYPENDDVLVNGDLTFKNNTILVKHQLGALPIEDFTGTLAFNEQGINQSSLAAIAFGYPLNIKIHSVKLPTPATTVSVDTECTVDSLKSHFNLPVLSAMSGSFLVNGLLKLTDDPDEPDTIKFNSSLQGLTINLPTPIGKTHDSKAPLEVNLDLNPQQSIRLRANYDARLSTDILFKPSKEAYELDSGQLRFGSASALNQKKPGLAVVGVLKGFDLQEWKDVLMRFSTEQANSSLLNKLRIINVKLDKLTFFKQQFDSMSVKARLLRNKDWSFSLRQKKISADLNYHVSTNLLSGHFHYLHLSKINTSGEDSSQGASTLLHPEKIPNLNLRIDDLSTGAIKIGDVTLKSQSSPGRLLLEYCRIDSPVYQFNVQGEWTQKKAKDQTKMQVKLNITDLAKSLARWNIAPDVDAKKGYMEFNGGWNSALYDFSLASLSGTMYLELKNGRITHLSHETEEKLDLGKLLSILSLQTIPRRLKLDFSDLSQEGYSFDVFKGNFEVKKGTMSTQDSYLDGPVAYASMKGSLDLVKHLYDLNLKISPHITASLPLVATIAGGPVVGVAAWMANKIINQGMQKISAYSYKISGPWNEPVVQQLSIVKESIKK